jgi:hypothetical protein
MRHIALWAFALLCNLAQAQAVDDLRLIQVQANLPSLYLWLNLETDTPIEREQFSVSIGSHEAKVFGIDQSEATQEGVGYVFLVDISKSLKSRQLVQIKRALHRWLAGMREHDQAALITFGHEVTHSQEFTTDRFRLDNAIGLLAATDMETSLYQALLEAINVGRSRAPGLPARRAIVLLSDGIDDSLRGASLNDVLRQNTEYRVPIYSIGFAAEPVTERKREGLRVLATLSRQSGGYFVQAGPSQLDDAYEYQNRLISQAYKLRVDCPECEADGQLQHINLTWSDGQQTLNDGMDFRLLPKSATHAAPQAATASTTRPDAGWSFFILTVGMLAFLLALLMIYRLRLSQPKEQTLDVTDLAQKSPPAPKPVAGLKIRLTVVTGMQKGHVYRLEIPERAILGRAASCELSLNNDLEVSTQHAILQRRNGQLSIRDLNSTNGTSVNGVPIHNDFPIRTGDLLLLGRTELRIEF